MIKNYMVRTHTPVIWNNRNCGTSVNHYRIKAMGELEATTKVKELLSQDETIEYIRQYKQGDV